MSWWLPALKVGETIETQCSADLPFHQADIRIEMGDLTLTFTDQAAWESWLALNGTVISGVWLRLAKRTAQQQTVSYAEALEIALCHGWIDGQKQAESEHFWLQRFTPRAARSIWSQINKTKAEALISAGRMHPAGMSEVERARQDGRWDRAYASASQATVPDDLQVALNANKKAKAFFATLNGQNRYAILFRIQNVKKAETRARKIAQFVAMLANNEKLHP